MANFSSLRARLVGTVFLAVAPCWVVMYALIKAAGTQQDLPWTILSACTGLLALAAAWFGGERFVLRQVRQLYRAARQLSPGDLGGRTGISPSQGELGQLAKTFDTMAASLEQRVLEREKAEKTLIARSLQQTVVSALGQFALVSNDFSALLNQAVMLVAQTLEVEYSCILELDAEDTLSLRAGVGWKPGSVGRVRVSADPRSQLGFTLTAGEPIEVEHLSSDSRFGSSTFLIEHGVVSGVTVAISVQGQIGRA